MDILDDTRDRIGEFKNFLGLQGHPRGGRRASLPPGTFIGPLDDLISQRTQERSLSVGAAEASMDPEVPLDPALPVPLDPALPMPLDRALPVVTDDGSQSRDVSPEGEDWYRSQFGATLPQDLGELHGARQPSVPVVSPEQHRSQLETPRRPASFFPSSMASSPLPAPPGTCNPRYITSSPHEAGSPWMPGSLPEENNASVFSSSPEGINAIFEVDDPIDQTHFNESEFFLDWNHPYDPNEFSQSPY